MKNWKLFWITHCMKRSNMMFILIHLVVSLNKHIFTIPQFSKTHGISRYQFQSIPVARIWKSRLRLIYHCKIIWWYQSIIICVYNYTCCITYIFVLFCVCWFLMVYCFGAKFFFSNLCQVLFVFVWKKI